MQNASFLSQITNYRYGAQSVKMSAESLGSGQRPALLTDQGQVAAEGPVAAIAPRVLPRRAVTY